MRVQWSLRNARRSEEARWSAVMHRVESRCFEVLGCLRQRHGLLIDIRPSWMRLLLLMKRVDWRGGRRVTVLPGLV